MSFLKRLVKAANNPPNETSKEETFSSETTLTIGSGSRSKRDGFWKELEKGRFQGLEKLVLTFSAQYGARRANRISSCISKGLDLKLLEEVGKLPQLEEIVLTTSIWHNKPLEDIRAEGIKALCRGAAKRKPGSKSLKSLVFENFTLKGDRFGLDGARVLNSIGVAASQLPDLESLKISNCEKPMRAHPLDLLEKLSQIPTLKHLEVTGWECADLRLPATDRTGVVGYLRNFWESCPALVSFDFEGLEELYWEVPPLVQRSCPNLRVLKVGRVDLQGQPAMDALLNLLNNGALQELEFCPRFDAAGGNQEGKSLHEFLAVTLPESLRNNGHLKACRIRLRDMAISDSHPRVPLDLQVAWLVLVRNHNHVLQDLCLKGGISGSGDFLYDDHRMHVAFLHNLKLNGLGRHRLLQRRYQETDSKEDWVLALEKCNMLSSPVYGNVDVSCLYDFLLLNPELVVP